MRVVWSLYYDFIHICISLCPFILPYFIIFLSHHSWRTFRNLCCCCCFLKICNTKWIERENVLYILSSVYDGHEHGLFMEKLDARIRNHDREIEKMCNHHFQGFVDSITELLKVRGEAQKLKVKRDFECCSRTVDSDYLIFFSIPPSQSQVIDTNRHLQDDGKDVSQIH